jgi:hypothetical protein
MVFRNATVSLAAAALAAASFGCGSAGPLGSGETKRVPKINFSSPSKQNEPADAEFSIKVSFEKVLVDDTWSLYYVSDATPAKGAAIIQDGPVTARNITWDTSQMPAGNYYLFGELNSLGGVVTASAPGSIVVDHPVADGNVSPVARLITPNGGETLQAGASKTVTWTATDGDSDAVTCTLEVSRDGGSTWTEEAADLAVTSYEWEIPGDTAAGVSFRLRVICADPSGATGADTTDRNFAIQGM